MLLNKVNIGSVVIIKKFNNSVDTIKRLNDMGITVGLKIKIIRKSPFLGAIEIKARDFYLVLRKQDACKIEVEL